MKHPEYPRCLSDIEFEKMSKRWNTLLIEKANREKVKELKNDPNIVWKEYHMTSDVRESYWHWLFWKIKK